MNSIISTLKSVFTRPQYTGLFWLVLRFYVGYEFVTAGLEKIESGKWLGAGGGAAIAGFLKGGLAKTTGAHPEVQPWYGSLINNVFLPNSTLFANLVAIGETAVGIALILGVMTKFAAFWGAVMNFSFVATGVSSANPPMMVLQVAMIFAGAGVAYYAADRFLLPYLAQTLHITTSRRTAPATVGLPTAGQVA